MVEKLAALFPVELPAPVLVVGVPDLVDDLRNLFVDVLLLGHPVEILVDRDRFL